jgi:hypothetical protein
VLTLGVRCAIDTDQVLRDQRHCGEGSGRANELSLIEVAAGWTA